MYQSPYTNQQQQSNQQKRIEELEQHILSSFPNLRGRLSSPTTRQELQNTLDTMCLNLGYEKYDQDIFDELVEKCEEDYQGILSPDNFLKVYIEAEQLLTMKYENLESNISKNHQNIRYLDQIIQELNTRQYSQQNQFGKNGNFIVLDRLHIQDLSSENQQCSSFVDIQLGQFSQQTNYLFTNSPTFDLNMEMPIHSFLENLIITVKDRQPNPYNPSENLFYGNLHLQVHALPFFNPRPNIYQLFKDAQNTGINVELTCHIEVNDTQRAVEDIKFRIQDQQQNISQMQEEKEAFDEQITFLTLPFKKNLNFKQTHHVQPLYDTNNNNQRQSQQPQSQQQSRQGSVHPINQSQQQQQQQQQYQPYSQSLVQQQNQQSQFQQQQQNPNRVIQSAFEPKHQNQNQQQQNNTVFQSSPPNAFQQNNKDYISSFNQQQQQQDQHQHQNQPLQSHSISQEPLQDHKFDPYNMTSPQQQQQQQHQQSPLNSFANQPQFQQQDLQQNQSSFTQPKQEFEQDQILVPSQNHSKLNTQQAQDPQLPYGFGQQQPVQEERPNPLMDDDDSDFDIVEFLKRSDIMTYIWIILAILICIKRPMLQDIMVGSFFILFLYQNKFQQHNYQQYIKYFSASIVLSLLIDMIWIGIYVGRWGENHSSDDQGAQSFVRHFIIFLSFVIALWKLAVLGSYYLLSQSFMDLEQLQEKFVNSIRDTVRVPDQQSPHKNYQQQQQPQQQQQIQYNQY